MSEVAIVEHEIDLALRGLRDWMRPQAVPTPLYLWPARSRIHHEPRGVVLIIGPWNYPMQLTLLPLVGALAAGCCAVLKPSELTLAAYLFSRDPRAQERFLKEISFGGGCINDCVTHLGNADLPFGGVGRSGLGAYHGARSFQTFTHAKSVLHKPFWLDLWLRYPPYSARKFTLLKSIMQASRWF